MFKTVLAGTAALALGASAAFTQTSDITTMSWDEIVAQAKEEGELTWYVWNLPEELRRFVKPFEEEYGITVTIPEGTNAGNAEKLLAERERETGDIDVFAWPIDAYETVEVESLFYPLSMLPEDPGRFTELAGIDNSTHVLPYWGNQTGIAYDPAHITPESLPHTPEDFAAFWTANPGKFGFNYENGGAGPSFIQSIARTITGFDVADVTVSDERLATLQPAFDFFKQTPDDYVITAGNADSITRISDGELWAAPAWEDHLAGLQKRGEIRKEIAFYIPEMGMNGGGNGVAIPKNAPHPAAAAVFMNWLTSAETQSALNREFGTAPMHKEADSSNALVPVDQRSRSTVWAAKPFGDALMAAFIDNVILEN
ncbi:extracellular solute-binding protein [Tabrizicola sp.]|uniref:extracellular solute-binding protein n=1 Tax=Tabrizicola sp. TaxID=2005166 RepID=UPI003F2E5ABE